MVATGLKYPLRNLSMIFNNPFIVWYIINTQPLGYSAAKAFV